MLKRPTIGIVLDEMSRHQTEESLQEQVRTATEQLEESKLEIVRLKAEIYDILSKNGDI